MGRIRFYFAEEDAGLFQGPNVFWPYSNDLDLRNTDDAGEITGPGNRTYDRGENRRGYTGDHHEGTAADFAGERQWADVIGPDDTPPTPATCGRFDVRLRLRCRGQIVPTLPLSLLWDLGMEHAPEEFPVGWGTNPIVPGDFMLKDLKRMATASTYTLHLYTEGPYEPFLYDSDVVVECDYPGYEPVALTFPGDPVHDPFLPLARMFADPATFAATGATDQVALGFFVTDADGFRVGGGRINWEDAAFPRDVSTVNVQFTFRCNALSI